MVFICLSIDLLFLFALMGQNYYLFKQQLLTYIFKFLTDASGIRKSESGTRLSEVGLYGRVCFLVYVLLVISISRQGVWKWFFLINLWGKKTVSFGFFNFFYWWYLVEGRALFMVLLSIQHWLGISLRHCNAEWYQWLGISTKRHAEKERGIGRRKQASLLEGIIAFFMYFWTLWFFHFIYSLVWVCSELYWIRLSSFFNKKCCFFQLQITEVENDVLQKRLNDLVYSISSHFHAYESYSNSFCFMSYLVNCMWKKTEENVEIIRLSVNFHTHLKYDASVIHLSFSCVYIYIYIHILLLLWCLLTLPKDVYC